MNVSIVLPAFSFIENFHLFVCTFLKVPCSVIKSRGVRGESSESFRTPESGILGVTALRCFFRECFHAQEDITSLS